MTNHDENKPHEKKERVRYNVPQRLARAQRKINSLQKDIQVFKEKIKEEEREKLALTLRALYNFPSNIRFKLHVDIYGDRRVCTLRSDDNTTALCKKLGVGEMYGTFRLPFGELFLKEDFATITGIQLDDITRLIGMGLTIDVDDCVKAQTHLKMKLEAHEVVLAAQTERLLASQGPVPAHVRNKRLMEQDIWTASDGRMYKLQDMEPEHLINCINSWMSKLNERDDHEPELKNYLPQWLAKLNAEMERRIKLEDEKRNASST